MNGIARTMLPNGRFTVGQAGYAAINAVLAPARVLMATVEHEDSSNELRSPHEWMRPASLSHFETVTGYLTGNAFFLQCLPASIARAGAGSLLPHQAADIVPVKCRKSVLQRHLCNGCFLSVLRNFERHWWSNTVSSQGKAL